MNRRRRIISAKFKSRIMSEAAGDGIIISEVAEKYNLPVRLLYAWRSKAKHRGSGNKIAGAEAGVKVPVQEPVRFVEARVSAERSCGNEASLLLRKLSLEFEDFSIAIEGRFNSRKLTELINILERPC